MNEGKSKIAGGREVYHRYPEAPEKVKAGWPGSDGKPVHTEWTGKCVRRQRRPVRVDGHPLVHKSQQSPLAFTA